MNQQLIIKCDRCGRSMAEWFIVLEKFCCKECTRDLAEKYLEIIKMTPKEGSII